MGCGISMQTPWGEQSASSASRDLSSVVKTRTVFPTGCRSSLRRLAQRKSSSVSCFSRPAVVVCPISGLFGSHGIALKCGDGPIILADHLDAHVVEVQQRNRNSAAGVGTGG